MLANLIGGFITILIGVTLIPVIGDAVWTAQNVNSTAASNVTGAAATIVNLSTLFFALGVMTIGVSLAVNGLRQAGLV